MAVLRVEDLSDPRLDMYCRLTSHQLRNALDPQRGVLIAESEIAIRVALANGVRPISLLLDENRLQSMSDVVSSLDDEAPVFIMSHELATRLTGYRVVRGALAAMWRPAPRNPGDLLRDARRVCVLENIVDTTNVGAIFRSAAALGVDAVLLAPNCCDPLSRRSVRVSMGNVFLVPWARMGGEWPSDCLGRLHDGGFTCAALALSDDSVSLGDPALRGIDRLAMLFGTEGDGLTREAIGGCDITVRIPMSHGVDSLNVAAASAVAFWELCERNS